MADYTTPPPTKIHPDSLECYEWIKSSPLAVLCGRNNSGKSFILRKLLREFGVQSAYLGPARYANFNVLTPYSPQRNRKQQEWQNLIRRMEKENQNFDNSPLNLQQAIAELSDDRRSVLFRLISELMKAEAEIKHTDPTNSMSQRYIDVDGHNLSFTSSGFRLVTTLLAALLDEDYTHFLIDEPELGLSPEVQGVLADWLLDAGRRGKDLKHIAGVVLATHSPVFLDRKNISCNVIVDRVGGEITLRRVGAVAELTALQFQLLGNRFETLFLPSAIVLVEGKTDFAYLNRLIALRFAGSTVSVIRAANDSRMRDVMNIAQQMLGDITRSPYAQRIFAVLDARHAHGLVEQLVAQGVSRNRVVIWSKNGIEHMYPRALLESEFGDLKEIVIDDDCVTIGDHEMTKQTLNDLVVNKMKGDEALPDELCQKLIVPLKTMLF